MTTNGETTTMMEKAIEILADLSETHKVYITGYHSQWLDTLRRDFRAAGLVDVEFIQPNQIKQGFLRGRRGVLLIVDLWDFPYRDQQFLLEEQRMLGLRNL